MMAPLARWAAARWWRASERAARNRCELYGGATGLRIVTFHETRDAQLEELRQVVEWCRTRFEIGSPADADDLCAGRWRASAADRVLITFDDGLASNYDAAVLLERIGIAATFFVVPSLLDRSIEEYVRFHERHGVEAHPPLATAGARGLSKTQVREMIAMGHRIGGHNFAHRDLGHLHDPADLRYEVANALDAVGEITSKPCSDFAIGFGQPENVSDEAAAYLLSMCARVFACHRGLNVPGRTPRFLLRHSIGSDHPVAFTRVCLEGGADHRLHGGACEMRRRVGSLPGPVPHGAEALAEAPAPAAGRRR